MKKKKKKSSDPDTSPSLPAAENSPAPLKNTPTEAEKANPAPAPTPAMAKPKISRGRKWRRRLIFTAYALFALAVISRILLISLLPVVLHRVAGKFGLSAQYERMELNILGGDVGIWHFTLSPAEGGNNLVESDYARVDVSTLDLLRGKLTIRRVEADGVNVNLERWADGTIPLLQKFMPQSAGTTAAAKPVAATPMSSPQTIDFTSPLEIDAFRLSEIHAHIHDAAVTPAVDANVDLNVSLTDVDSLFRPTHLEMDLRAAPIMDLLHVEADGTGKGKVLDATMRVQISGLHPIAAAGYLQPLGIRPIASGISLRMNGDIKTSAATRPDAIAAALTFNDIAVTADGQDAASLDQFTVRATAVNFTMAEIEKIVIDAGSLKAARTADGNIRFAGLEITSAPTAATETPPPPTAAAVPLAPLHWSVGQIDINKSSAEFHDDAVSPAADLQFDVDGLSIGSVSPDHPDLAIPISGTFIAPQIAKSIRLDGQAKPFAKTISADLKIATDGFKPDAIKPYLDQLGLESEYQNGSFGCQIHADVTPGNSGSISANAKIENISVKDSAISPTELVGMNSVDISGASWDPTANRIGINSIDVAGPDLSGRRDADGVISALGFRMKPPASAQNKSSGQVAEANKPTANKPVPSTQSTDWTAMIPKLEIGKLTWKGVQIRFDDLAVSPPENLSLSDAGVEISDLNIDLGAKNSSAKPGQIHAWLSAPGIADNISVQGSVIPSPQGPSAELTIDGKGITAAKIEQYFRGSGIEPILKDGSFHLKTTLSLATDNGGLSGKVGVTEFSYKDGSTELVGVDSAQIGRVTIRGNEISSEPIVIKSPRISVSREQDGSFVAAGIRITPPKAQEKPPEALASSKVVPEHPAATQPATNPVVANPPAGIVALLSKLDVQDASLQWTDEAIEPNVSIHLTSTTTIENFEFGKPTATPATINVTAHEDSSLANATVSGQFTPSPVAPAATLEITASGIRPGNLAPYIPPGVNVTLTDGRFHAKIDAAISANPQGGQTGHLFVTDLSLADGPSTPLAQFDSLRLSAARIDPATMIDVDEITMDGLETSATKSADGVIHAGGLALGGPVKSAPTTTTAQSPEPPAATEPLIATQNTAAFKASDLTSFAKKVYPRIILEKLDLNVRKLTVLDQSRADSAPLVVSDLHLKNSSRIELLGSDPKGRTPIVLQLSGSIDPLAKSVLINTTLNPFVERPELSVDVDISGIRGDGITKLVPELKKQIDGSTLADGRLKAHLQLSIKKGGTDPLDFDLSKGFESNDFSLKGVEFRDGENGPILAGVDEVSSEGIRVDPAQSRVLIKDITVTNPAARVWRDAAGAHVLGIAIKLPETKPPATTKPTSDKKSAFVPSLTDALSGLVVADVPQPPQGEILIQRVQVSGLDFNLEDRTCNPPLIVPLTGLDFEARDLSSRMPYEDQACRFNVIVNSGETNKQDLFSQAEVSGVISLYPHPKGWVKASISGLDLKALQGEARTIDENLNGGTFDGVIELRLNGDETGEIRVRPSVTELKLTEGSKGLLGNFFKVPLAIAIPVLQDADGSISLPVTVPIDKGNLNVPYVLSSVAGAVAEIVAKAVAAAPLKPVDAALGFLGLGKSKDDLQPVTIPFDPAGTSLNFKDIIELRPLLQRLKDDPTLVLTLHEDLGGGDIFRAATLANPSRQDAANLSFQFRQKKFDLLAARAQAAQEAEAQLASGSTAYDAVSRLRNIDQALAATEDALDNLYELQQPGAEKQADRRTRAACLQIGQQRLEAIRDVLLSAGISDPDQQIKMTHAAFKQADGNSGGTVTIVLSRIKKE